MSSKKSPHNMKDEVYIPERQNTPEQKGAWSSQCYLIGAQIPVWYLIQGCLYFFKIFIGVELLYNVVLVSTLQQSESAIHIHISPFFVFPSHLGHHRSLSTVPCAIQQALISYLFYTQYQQCMYVNPNLPIVFNYKIYEGNKQEYFQHTE